MIQAQLIYFTEDYPILSNALHVRERTSLHY